MTSVAVVIPSFQHARWVGEAVESALSQTRPPDDVVVVDDGSTDGSLEILAGFGSRIRVLRAARKGVGAVYNMGFEATSSDLVAFLESDDVLESRYLEETGDFLEGYREIHWVSTARLLIDASGAPTGEISRRRLPGAEFTFEGFLSSELGASSTPVVRRGALADVGLWSEESYAADTDMALRFSLVHRMGYLDRPLYRYRRHGQNASTSLLENVRLNVPILERLLDPPHPALAGREAAVKKALAKMLGMQAALLMESGSGATVDGQPRGGASPVAQAPASPRAREPLRTARVRRVAAGPRPLISRAGGAPRAGTGRRRRSRLRAPGAARPARTARGGGRSGARGTPRARAPGGP
jgi:glycosyltransferase involved in cell wall biosynthesis